VHRRLPRGPALSAARPAVIHQTQAKPMSCHWQSPVGSLRQKCDQRIERRVGLLDHHHVPARGQRDEPRTLDRPWRASRRGACGHSVGSALKPLSLWSATQPTGLSRLGHGYPAPYCARCSGPRPWSAGQNAPSRVQTHRWRRLSKRFRAQPAPALEDLAR
jgi:hypothetical protein